MRTIIVTGTGGFVGARAAEFFKKDSRVITPPRGFMAEVNEQSALEFFTSPAPDAIIHCAAISDVGDCEKAPESSHRANVELPLWIAKAAKQCGAKLICMSSDQVYTGLDPEGVFDETTPLAPANVYGRHKLEMEKRVLDYLPSAIMLRDTWMYDFPGYGLPIHGNMLLIMLSAAAQGRSVRFSDRELRGITYVREVISNLEKMLTLPGGVYNYGSENPLNMFETALAFKNAFKLDVEVEKLSIPCSLAFSNKKLQKLGVTFDETKAGIERCINDYDISWLTK